MSLRHALARVAYPRSREAARRVGAWIVAAFVTARSTLAWLAFIVGAAFCALDWFAFRRFSGLALLGVVLLVGWFLFIGAHRRSFWVADDDYPEELDRLDVFDRRGGAR